MLPFENYMCEHEYEPYMVNELSLSPGENQSLCQPVSPAKGHGHPDAGDRRIPQLRRNQIVIGFVDVIRRGTDRHFYDG